MELNTEREEMIELNSEVLSSLNITIIDQQSLEAKVEKALDDAAAVHSKKQQINITKTDEIEAQQQINKFILKKSDLELRLQSMQKRMTDPRSIFSVQKQIKESENLILLWKQKLKKLSNKLDAYNSGLSEELFLSDEIEQDEETHKEKTAMIKSGEMTPFGTIIGNSEPMTSGIIPMKKSKPLLTDFEKYLSDQMDRQKSIKRNNGIESKLKSKSNIQSQNRIFCRNISRKRKLDHCEYTEEKTMPQTTISYVNEKSSEDSDYVPSDVEIDNESGEDTNDLKGKKNSKSNTRPRRVKDDGNLIDYRERIKKWKKQRLKNVQLGIAQLNEKFHEVSNGCKIQTNLWEALFRYQRTGVQWLWELHSQQCGGIMGDEMGLGKTIQIIVFLAGISASQVRSSLANWRGLGPVLIICPATVLHQWLKEFHKWCPQFRIAILHGSGSFTGKRSALIHNINSCNGILLTSYTGARRQLQDLIKYQWHYLILDEGHQIRNPTAQITMAMKMIDTPHRIILSGSPIQNSLKELWSLFDFIFPGKLGTLPVFLEQFAVPITQGGYSNASKLEVETAFRCATVLRDTISPFLLRRMKSDVRSHLSLPDKNEQVLFCGLTDEQRSEYISYLEGKEVKMISRGRLMAFVGLITLRKICNHPDIYNGGPRDPMCSKLQPETKYGYWKRSGKMVVLEAILKLWNKQGHRVLLFTQSRQMLQILLKFMQTEGYTYFKMDGSTTVGSRQLLIDKFNSEPSIFVFLLTTRVGGIGVNLTGADRVVIYDPDWNPSTDLQARERAWRIGQLRHVTIYRLLTAGTIEEKIYHRQIFKQSITNRVLKDPKQQRFFKTSDLSELFTLSDGDKVTETSSLFAGTGSEILPKKRRKREQKCDDAIKGMDRSNTEAKALKEMQEDEDDTGKETASQTEYEQQMREYAKMLSKKIGEGRKPNNNNSKSKKGKKFEGARIQNLIKKRIFKDSEIEDKCINADQDAYVLKKLFQKSGIHSAYSHDMLVEGQHQDHLLLKAEADRVAEDALRKVRASSSHCSRPNRIKRFGLKTNARIYLSRDSQSNIETGEKRKDDSIALSSAQLILRMRRRNVPDMNNELQEEDGPTGDDDGNVELLSDIRYFIVFQSMHNGKASTQEILNKFRERLPPEKSLVFRKLLNNICDFIKKDGKGIWHLKAEFR